jgi:hypothetical protein
MRFIAYNGFLVVVFVIHGCASIPKGPFVQAPLPSPDYSLHAHWAALPQTKDSADVVPIEAWSDVQSESPADVFFLHPTTYTGKHGHKNWNAAIDDADVNLRTDKTTIRYQASLFNGAGRVFAPRYRQGHLECFYDIRKKADATKALDVAYRDIRDAFHYYIRHYNAGRPFIVAAHSQGTFHGIRLLREEIEGTPLAQQLVVAYLVGYPVREEDFQSTPACATPDQTGCFCSWRTFRSGYIPPKLHFPGNGIVVTNPVTWDNTKHVSKPELQLGAVLRPFHQLYTGAVSTEVYKDLLWVNKPRFKGSFLFLRKNYHIADYNLFYADVRQNAQNRVRTFLAK